MRRIVAALGAALVLVVAVPSAALACGGLIAARHAEVLRRATTLAAWANGIEHYITGFQFAGSADSFGYVIPLPAAPSSIRKGGDWTLERLEREAFPPPTLRGVAGLSVQAAGPTVAVIQHVVVDSLDIKVVKGGGRDVAAWAREHGFDLTSDTDTVLASYPANIFALAKFDKAGASKRFVEGQGVVIDFQIPLPGPWIPLRILTLGKPPVEQVDAHLFMMTPERPTLSPALPVLKGLHVVYDGWASDSLIADLRSDTGTKWMPDKMWFTALSLDTPASNIGYDLSAISGGATLPPVIPLGGSSSWVPWVFAVVLAGLAFGIAVRAPRANRASPADAPL